MMDYSCYYSSRYFRHWNRICWMDKRFQAGYYEKRKGAELFLPGRFEYAGSLCRGVRGRLSLAGHASNNSGQIIFLLKKSVRLKSEDARRYLAGLAYLKKTGPNSYCLVPAGQICLSKLLRMMLITTF